MGVQNLAKQIAAAVQVDRGALDEWLGLWCAARSLHPEAYKEDWVRNGITIRVRAKF